MIVEAGLELRLLPNGGWDPRIEVVQVGDLVRSHLIYTERFTVVFDTLLGPQSGGWLARRAAEHGRPVVVVVSHSDWDHCWGNQCFPDAPILATPGCAERMLGAFGQAELAQKRSEHADYEAVRIVPPSIVSSGDWTLHGGDLTLQLFEAAGHRSDHIALWIPEIRTLLPADGVETPFALLDDEGGGPDTMIFTLQRFLGMQPKWTLANHAPPQPGTELIQSCLDYYLQAQDVAARAESLAALHAALPYTGPPDADFYRKDHARILEQIWRHHHKPR